MRRRALKRGETISSAGSGDSGLEGTPQTQGGNSMSADTGGTGEESDTEKTSSKSKSRRRLWDSFLYRTRKIRIRKKERGDGRLDKRSSR